MVIPKHLEKTHFHILGPAQNEYFVASVPFFFWGPLCLAVFTTRIFLYPSGKTQHENQSGLLCPFLTISHLKAGFTHCNFSPGRQISQVAKWSLPSEESALAACLSAAFFTGLVLRKYNFFISLSFSIGTGRVVWEKTHQTQSICNLEHCALSVGVVLHLFPQYHLS